MLVVFRGAITVEDWSRAVQSRNFRDAPNPIDEDYEGKTDTINMSAGFYRYLFRVRKDTGTQKYDEIANLAYKFGKERIGDDFQLVVTGHSLGGALSTVFSFFASTDNRFTRNGPVKCFNFGSPYVGGKKFMLAFHHQEQRHMLMYARFFNHNDIGKQTFELSLKALIQELSSIMFLTRDCRSSSKCCNGAFLLASNLDTVQLRIFLLISKLPRCETFLPAHAMHVVTFRMHCICESFANNLYVLLSLIGGWQVPTCGS